MTATRIATSSTVSVTPETQQYSDKVNLEATLSPGSQCTLVPATNVTFYLGARKLATVKLTAVDGALKATLAKAVVLEAPGVQPVRAVFGGLSPFFSVSNVTNSLTVTAEDARASYIGPTTVFATAAGAATVALKAIVKDVTAVTGDPAFDANGGQIAKARVAFVNRDTGQVIKEVAVVAGSNTRLGTAAFNWAVNIGTESSVTYNIGIVVKNFYTDDTSADAAVTVRKR